MRPIEELREIVKGGVGVTFHDGRTVTDEAGLEEVYRELEQAEATPSPAPTAATGAAGTPAAEPADAAPRMGGKGK